MLVANRNLRLTRETARCECRAMILSAARFCPQCGAARQVIRPAAIASESRALVRRVLAEAVDRLAPLPFIAYLFPPWILVVVLYHLICDGSPSGRSPGKWVFRLRVVSVSTHEPCGVWRSVLRRLTTAAAQAAYCLWFLVPLAVAYDLVSLGFVWLNPTGRRLEDYLAGTQVIAEGQYQRTRPVCGACGSRIAVWSRYCPHCGERRNRDGE